MNERSEAHRQALLHSNLGRAATAIWEVFKREGITYQQAIQIMASMVHSIGVLNKDTLAAHKMMKLRLDALMARDLTDKITMMGEGASPEECKPPCRPDESADG